MSIMHHKERAISLEAFSINASYLVQVLKEINTRNQPVDANMLEICKKLFEDTDKAFSCLKKLFIEKEEQQPTGVVGKNG